MPEYIGVKTGLFGGPSTLIPMDIVRVNDLRQLVEVASDKDTIEEGPSFGDDAEITAEFEDRVYTHFQATREPPPPDRGGYGAYDDENPDVDVAYGERSRTPQYGTRRSTSARRETARPRTTRAPQARHEVTRRRGRTRSPSRNRRRRRKGAPACTTGT